MSYGSSARRARTESPAAPAVAWKNEPCGRPSITVPPACNAAAADSADTPASANVPANVCDAIVTPAAVDAVAPASNTPASGASAATGSLQALSSFTKSMKVSAKSSCVAEVAYSET